MTQEDKQLLLKDLCGRLPYGVVYHANLFGRDENFTLNATMVACWLRGEKVRARPYLRPLSSMTEEEQKEFVKFHCVNICPIVITEKLTISNEAKMFDWLNAHHFDFRNLLAKGLAIEVTEEFNPYKD